MSGLRSPCTSAWRLQQKTRQEGSVVLVFSSPGKKKKKKEAVETGKIRPPPNLDKVRATGIFFVVVVPQS